MSNPRPFSLEHWAVHKPDVPALFDGDTRLSWAQWNAASDRLARSLMALGVQGTEVIAVRSRVRHEWCVAAGAAAKLGCPMLCLNWRNTATETRHMLTDSSVRVLIVDDAEPSSLQAAWDGLGVILITIDAPTPGFHSFAELVARPAAPLHSLAETQLIIYTSGTTGAPKGVQTDRPSGDPQVVAEYMADVIQRGNQDRGDVVLSTLPVHHAAGSNTIQRAIYWGNSLILMRRYEPEAALKLIHQHRVSFWFTVPTLITRMQALPPEILARYDVASMRVLLIGSAPVAADMKAWIVEYFGARLTETYGSTETGLITGLSPVMYEKKPASSGTPFRHAAVKIRDEKGAALATGEVGEIWAKTPFVVDRYLGTPRLGPDVLDAEGFFRMGDVGWLDEEGYLFITDRVKDLIISGGVNIYPAEIEAVLLRHPSVQDVAIIGIPNDEFGEEIKGFVELKPGATTTMRALLDFCVGELASYKHPRSLELTAKLPRNTMGKLLKRELREPFWRDRERKV